MNELSKSSQHRRPTLLAGVLVATLALASGAYALAPSKPKPVGAALTYVSTIKGVSIDIISAKDDAGSHFSHPGNFGYSDRPELGRKTMGSAPVPYGLPKWVDFEWREPTDIVRAEHESYDAWGAMVDEDTRKLARKKERVFIASKIPPGAIEEVRQAQAETVRGKLPDKMLRVYFVWTPSGIRVRWRVQRDHPGLFTEWQGEPLK